MALFNPKIDFQSGRPPRSAAALPKCGAGAPTPQASLRPRRLAATPQINRRLLAAAKFAYLCPDPLVDLLVDLISA